MVNFDETVGYFHIKYIVGLLAFLIATVVGLIELH